MPAENEFFAENTTIEILPSFKGDKLEFVTGTFGPFKPAKPVVVPIWLAIYLKQRNKCDVQVPSWLDPEFLTRVRQEERDLKDKFSDAIPYYYFEIAHLLLTNCESDFKEPNKVKSLLEDIQETRKEKLLKIIRNIEPETPVKHLSRAGAQELNTMRPACQAAYAVINKMQTIKEQAQAADEAGY